MFCRRALWYLQYFWYLKVWNKIYKFFSLWLVLAFGLCYLLRLLRRKYCLFDLLWSFYEEWFSTTIIPLMSSFLPICLINFSLYLHSPLWIQGGFVVLSINFLTSVSYFLFVVILYSTPCDLFLFTGKKFLACHLFAFYLYLNLSRSWINGYYSTLMQLRFVYLVWYQ